MKIRILLVVRWRKFYNYIIIQFYLADYVMPPMDISINGSQPSTRKTPVSINGSQSSRKTTTSSKKF